MQSLEQIEIGTVNQEEGALTEHLNPQCCYEICSDFSITNHVFIFSITNFCYLLLLGTQLALPHDALEG